MNSIVHTITQNVSISGYTVPVLDSSIETLYLRRYNETSPGVFEYAEEFLGVSIGTAKFRFDIPDGNFQMWKTASPDGTGSNRIDSFAGGSNKYKWIGDNTLDYLKLVSDSYDLDSKEIKNGLNPITENTSLITGTESDSRYPTIADLNSLTSIVSGLTGYYISKVLGITESIYSTLIFRKQPYLLETPSAPFHIPHVKFVKDYVNSILAGITSGDITAYQQSLNIIRCLYSGTDEAGRSYTTVEACKFYAESYASAIRIITILLEGGENITTNYDLLPVGSLAEFVHYAAYNTNIKMKMASGSYIGTVDNKTIFHGITLYNENEGDETDLENCIFINCIFDNAAESGIFNFDTCEFYGINTFNESVTFTFTTCKGMIYDSRFDRYHFNDSELYLKSFKAGTAYAFDVLNSKGDIRARRLLGRKLFGNIASASSITLTDGNFFSVSGTNTILTIVSTDWTEGSIITLYFTDNLTIDVGGGNISNSGGGNISVTAGQCYQFIYYSSNWVRIL